MITFIIGWSLTTVLGPFNHKFLKGVTIIYMQRTNRGGTYVDFTAIDSCIPFMASSASRLSSNSTKPNPSRDVPD